MSFQAGLELCMTKHASIDAIKFLSSLPAGIAQRQMLAGAAFGGTSGAVYGALMAEEGDRLNNALKGALASGIVTAGAGGVAGAMAGNKIMKEGFQMAGKANLDPLIKRLSRDRMASDLLKSLGLGAAGGTAVAGVRGLTNAIFD